MVRPPSPACRLPLPGCDMFGGQSTTTAMVQNVGRLWGLTAMRHARRPAIVELVSNGAQGRKDEFLWSPNRCAAGFSESSAAGINKHTLGLPKADIRADQQC